ncbi:glycosyl transferase [Cryobacterium zongtaii]|uniref:4,4'-diaponeurosporenoate glycosyltransferase n=1 Tax=Cryobacterium zongtaii TaxID=1259217 RepID=A0A2S3Z506_9MICO|nr:glycosyltransferase [Cryobacterium zongtaii]POH58728.1 glycosyl transferase [Cryobacterium zongtaii]
MTTRIDRLIVVVPARDEESRLPRCLAALADAVQAVEDEFGTDAPAISVVVVLDRCTDGSAEVVAQWPQFRALECSAGSVGSARRAGVAHLLTDAAAAHTWVATTDADSAVPRRWLTAQLALAEAGTELVLGTVLPDDELPVQERDRWHGSHTLVDGHPHVHGANLGVRADRYLQADGFSDVDSDEDVLLVEALRTLGARECRTALIPVLTSGRLDGRVPGGFGGYLADQVMTR